MIMRITKTRFLSQLKTNRKCRSKNYRSEKMSKQTNLIMIQKTIRMFQKELINEIIYF